MGRGNMQPRHCSRVGILETQVVDTGIYFPYDGHHSAPSNSIRFSRKK